MRRKGSAPGHRTELRQGEEDRAVGRRALLTGGVVAAGVVGAGLAEAAAAGTANAASGDPVIQGALNDVGGSLTATEIRASTSPLVSPLPALILTNNGGDGEFSQASPSLRLTPNPHQNPSMPTAGGDMVATSNGELWFTHNVPGFGPSAAIMHTDANSNTFVPLTAPIRLLDTRNSGGRTHVIDPSGKFDSKGRLLVGRTIHVNLSSLVDFADAVTANLTVTGPTASGWLVLWSGAVARPNASSVNFAKGQALSNMTVSGIAFNSSSGVSSLAIYTAVTTHVLLDVAGFTTPSVEFVSGASRTAPATRAAQIHAARAAIARRPS